MKLSEAQEAELQFLRRRVDLAIDNERRADAPPNASQTLWYARERLEQFVSGLRKDGYDI
jgi:hypothetical protein